MNVKRFAKSFGYSTIGVLVLTGFLSSLVERKEVRPLGSSHIITARRPTLS